MSEKHERIAYFDNVKGILIALVVLGHVISPVIATNPYANLLHHTIYLFHMPLFVFTTGLFSASVFSSGTLKVERILSYVLLALGLQLFAVLPFILLRSCWAIYSYSTRPPGICFHVPPGLP